MSKIIGSIELVKVIVEKINEGKGYNNLNNSQKKALSILTKKSNLSFSADFDILMNEIAKGEVALNESDDKLYYVDPERTYENVVNENRMGAGDEGEGEVFSIDNNNYLDTESNEDTKESEDNNEDTSNEEKTEGDSKIETKNVTLMKSAKILDSITNNLKLLNIHPSRAVKGQILNYINKIAMTKNEEEYDLYNSYKLYMSIEKSSLAKIESYCKLISKERISESINSKVYKLLCEKHSELLTEIERVVTLSTSVKELAPNHVNVIEPMVAKWSKDILTESKTYTTRNKEDKKDDTKSPMNKEDKKDDTTSPKNKEVSSKVIPTTSTTKEIQEVKDFNGGLISKLTDNEVIQCAKIYSHYKGEITLNRISRDLIVYRHNKKGKFISEALKVC